MNIKNIEEILKKISDDRNWDKFHSPKNLSMALSVESSELVEIFQWLTEEESKNLSDDNLQKVKDEIGDITTYLIRLCMKLNINLEEATLEKIEKSTKRYTIEKSKNNANKQ